MTKRKYTPKVRNYVASVVKPGGSAVAYLKNLGRDGSFTWTYELTQARRFTLDQINGRVKVHSSRLVVEPVYVGEAVIGLI